MLGKKKIGGRKDTSGSKTPELAMVEDLKKFYHKQIQDLEDRLARWVASREASAAEARCIGVQIRVLDLGSGQALSFSASFSSSNQVTLQVLRG